MNNTAIGEDDSVQFVRIGEVLVQEGLIDEEEVEAILEEQKQTGRPFGDLAERLFGISPGDVERAWVEQFSRITEHINPVLESFDPEVADRVSRRQAWQFGCLPIRMEGGELIIATTQGHLLRAVRFAGWSINDPVCFVLADQEQLEEALSARYPLPGVTLKPIAS